MGQRPVWPSPSLGVGGACAIMGSAEPEWGVGVSFQSLYRKWRSQTFGDIVGQEHITRTLLNALRSGRVAHAYLFCGPRGTGKTSTARLLAKAVNCLNNGAGEPCNECTLCRSITAGSSLDVIEIDGASNRGIDDIRDLREKVNFAPAEGQRKFYIIDEVHQLSTDAFNALLKTLEEPPAHTIFVLASTEAHKIPATILSRCQRFDFRRLTVREVAGRLQYICEQEGIESEPAALDLVARSATGSLRDAISTLDQLRAYADGAVTVAQVEGLLGTRAGAGVRDLAAQLFAKDLGAGLRLINALADDGVDMRQLGRDLVDYLRALLLVKASAVPAGGLDLTAEGEAALQELARGPQLADVVRCLQLFSQADFAARGLVRLQLPLEMAFAAAVLGEESAAPADPAMAARQAPSREAARPAGRAPAVVPPPRSVAARPAPARPAAAEATRPAEPLPAPPAPVADPGPAPSGALSLGELQGSWGQAVEAIGRGDKKLLGLLRDCTGPERVEDRTVVLGVKFAFHKGAIEQEKNRAIVEAALSAAVGRPCLIRCVLSSGREERAALPASPLDDPLVKEAVSRGARIRTVTNSTPREEPDDK